MILQITSWHWFALSSIMLIFDVALSANFFILWLGVCAAIMGGLLKINPSLSWEWQLLIFAVNSLVCIILWRSYLRNYPIQSDKPNLNRRSKQYIGRMFLLTQPIKNNRGKITVDDSIWTVSGPDLAINTQVIVISTDGIILQVKPYCNDS